MTIRSLCAAAVLALTLPLAACGSSDDAGSGTWSFTDDVGTEITRDEAPQRIVAHQDVAVALADMGLGDLVVGTFGAPDNPDPDLALEPRDLDVDSVEDVTGGGDYGDIDLEKLAGLEPDLIVTTTFGGGTLWYINDDVAAKLDGTYDIAQINLEGEDVNGVVGNSERLAAALGAEESDFTEGREALAAVGDRLESIAADAGDPRILVVAPGDDILYVANIPAYSDLAYLRDEVGLDLVTPDESDVDEGGYWHNVSWENADVYDADVAMWDSRGGEANLTLLGDQPVWGKVRAAQDEAYLPWRVESAPSALGYASTFEKFADDFEELS
ncbi:ABC transporter substrate-binding protein [Aeromicrobium sp. CTD01-1L150]|uniref:ABC transporter substrate-binding protein n=1 Tax=Aeromicrobium sp. CTD01-1L150 TaxID=3341830 RepID=UPI0035BFEADF